MNRSNHQSPPLSPISPSNHCVIYTNVKPIQRSTPTDHRTNHHFTTIDLRECFRDFSKSTIWEKDFRALELFRALKRWKREGDFGLKKRSLEIFIWVIKLKSTISLSLPNLQPNCAPSQSNLTTDTPPLRVQRRTKEMHTFSNLKNPILLLSPPTSLCPFSSFHSSALTLALSALSLPFLLSDDPNPCPFSDVENSKTLSGLSTRKVTMVGAWWSGLSYLGSLVFTTGLDPPIVAWLWGRLGFLLTQMGF